MAINSDEDVNYNYQTTNNTDDEVTSLLSDSVNVQQSSQTRYNQSGISWYFAVFLIVNAALGAGLLNFAKAFNEAGGIVVSVLMQLFLVVLIVGALFILAYCTDNNQASNFQDVVYSMCGKKWQTINSLCIILYMFGCCITFFIIIGDQLDQILNCIVGPSSMNHWYFNRKFTITVSSLLLILPLCYPKRIDFLTYPSMFAVIAIIYIVILIPIKYAHANTENIVIKTKPDHWMDIFTVMPVICFGYQCHVNVVPIYACLKHKNLREFSKALVCSIIIVFSAYTISAIFGYLTFGTKVDDDVLKSYNSNDASVLVSIIMYLIKTYTSYPLNLFCARTAIEGLWIEMFQLNANAILNKELKRRVIIVTIWFILSLFIALFMPNISVVIRYLGALASTFMFIFPGLCLLFLTERRNDQSKSTISLYVLACIYVTVGVFIMGLVVTQSLYTDLNL